MTTRLSATRAPLLALLGSLLLAGCGGSVGNIAGSWSGLLTFKSTSAALPTGSTEMTFSVDAPTSSGAVAFTSQPTQSDGVKWSCPEGQVSGGKITFPSSCTLTNTLSCKTEVTPTLDVASGSNPTTMTWEGYSYTWTGSDCVANGVKVTVASYTLTRE